MMSYNNAINDIQTEINEQQQVVGEKTKKFIDDIKKLDTKISQANEKSKEILLSQKKTK